MERFVSFCTDHPLRIALAAAMLLLLGAMAWRSIPLVYLYDPSAPQLVVVVRYPSAPAALVSTQVTARLEAEVRTVHGVRRVLARAVDGSASLRIEFDRSMSFSEGERQVRDRVGRLRWQLPRETREPEIFQVGGGDDQSVLEVAISSDRFGRGDLSDWIERVVRHRLEAVPGVAELSISGDAPRQLDIEFDDRAAGALGVSIDEVVTAVQRESVQTRTGYVHSSAHQRILRVADRLDSALAFESIAIRRDGPRVLRLGDVAVVRDGEGESPSLMRFDGKDCVVVKVFPLKGASVAEVAQRVRGAVDILKVEAPAGTTVAMIVDNSEYAQASLDAVTRALLEGAALTVLLVALCLRSARGALITALTLPLSVLATVLCLWALGQSLNLFTLLALTLAIGVLIDDAIVVRENIVRKAQAGLSIVAAAVAGTIEIARAVACTTLVIVAVFLPLMLAGGPLGPFVRQFALTVAVAVSISLLVSFTVDPALSVLLKPSSAGTSREALPSILGRTLDRWTGLLLKWRRLVVASALLMGAAGVWMAQRLPIELMPEFDEGIVELNVEFPAGSPPGYLRAKAQQVEAVIRELPEVTHSLVGIGTPRSRSAMTLFLRLKPADQRSKGFREVEEVLRARLSRVAGADTSPTIRPVGIFISGPDDVVLESIRQAVSSRIQGIKGLGDVVSTDVEEGQAVVLELDRDLLADANLSPSQVAGLVGTFLSGSPIAIWHAPNGRQYDIVLRFPQKGRSAVEALEDLQVVSRDVANGATPLRAVADIRVGDRPRVIERVAGMRVARVQAGVSGRPLGDVASDVRKALTNVPIPPGYQLEYGGHIKELEASRNEFSTAIVLAALCVFCVLAMFYGGVILPLVVMASIPLGCVGALAWLWLAGQSLNVFSGVGLLLVAGVVAKNGILLIDLARRAEREPGVNRMQAIKTAVVQRTRPILMTSGAMMMGMLPIAIGIGHGGEQLSAMGQSIVAGIVTSTALSLLVIPALYVMLPIHAQQKSRATSGSPV